MLIAEFKAELLKKKELTDDTILFTFKIPSSFSFQAGQFIMVRVEKDIEYKWRAYSILNPPSQKEYLELCIKIVPGGFASEFFKQFDVGTKVSMKGPIGGLLFDSSSEEHWFICAGTGMAPFYSMILENISKLPPKKFKLIMGTRHQNSILFHQEFLNLAKKHSSFEYVPTLSREKWDGKMGHVQEHITGDLKGKTFYICGLKELVLETKELLLQNNVPESRIRVERYN